MIESGDVTVSDASKTRKRALAGLQKIHEAAACERKTIDLDAVRLPLNRPTQKNRSAGFTSVESAVSGMSSIEPKLSGRQIEGGDVSGSDFGGLKAESFKGPRIENMVKLNTAEIGPPLTSKNQKEIGPKLSGLQIGGGV